MWISSRRCRAADLSLDWGPKFAFRAIVDFLTRENRRSTKCLIASLGQTLVVTSGFLCPRVGREWSRSMALLGGSGVPARLRVWAALRQRFHIPSVHGPAGRTTLRALVAKLAPTSSPSSGEKDRWVVRKKTRSRAGTPDAGALLFNVLLLFGWGYRVTPGVSPGRRVVWSKGQNRAIAIWSGIYRHMVEQANVPWYLVVHARAARYGRSCFDTKSLEVKSPGFEFIL